MAKSVDVPSNKTAIASCSSKGEKTEENIDSKIEKEKLTKIIEKYINEN